MPDGKEHKPTDDPLREASANANAERSKAAKMEAATGEGHEKEINREAWNHPGEFKVRQADDGRTERIEGWLSSREGTRSEKDQALQGELRKEAGLDKRQDAGHIIGFALGGPSAEQHSDSLAKANLVPMDGRINKSYFANVESYFRDELKSGKEIYCQADVNYIEAGKGQKIPESVTHRFFTRGEGDKPQSHPIAEVTTRIDIHPAQTVRDAVSDNSEAKRAKDILDPSRKGTAGTHDN